MEKVLVVDDSPMVRKLVQGLVEKKGATPVEARNYDETLQMFHQEKPGIILLDIIMDNNKWSGIDALKKIKEESPETVVIMVTSLSEEEEVIKECVDYGANEYISKPFKEEEVLNILDMYLQGVDNE